MKLYNLIIFLFCSTYIFSQNITGSWYGVLSVQGAKLNLIFHINQNDTEYHATMDSPDQKAFGLKATKTEYIQPNLVVELKNLGIVYQGKFLNEKIEGVFSQNGSSFPLILSKDSSIIKPKIRFQEPIEPFPYRSTEVSIANKKTGVTLSGTLTLPANKGKYPAVILISGSGPQDRNEEILGHKPFLVISDYLTKNGYAVLRFDDRGFGKSTGNFSSATSNDFANDVESCFTFLSKQKEVDSKKIGLVGHSEGGLIAPIVAARNKKVKFIVLLAGPGLRGDQVLLLQQRAIAESMGVTNEEIESTLAINSAVFELIVNDSTNNTQQLKDDLTLFLKNKVISDTNFTLPLNTTESQFINKQIQHLTSPWMLNFIRFNPATVLTHVLCPVLAMNGEKDIQVLPNENLEAIQKALADAGNKSVTIKKYPGLNHLFQTCSSCTFEEYSELSETFSAQVLADLVSWMNGITTSKK